MDPYRAAVNRFRGKEHFQELEQLTAFLARRQWGGLVTKPDDREGLPDWEVYDGLDPSRLIATLECKAWSQPLKEHEIRSIAKVLSRHQEYYRSLGQESATHYFVIAVPVKAPRWDSVMAEFGLSHVLWDADELARMAYEDLDIAEYMAIPICTDLLRSHSLETMLRRGKTWWDTVPIRRIIDEEEAGGPGIRELDTQASQLLLYGPPYIGKSCLAVRQAWRWIGKHRPNAFAFLINSSSHSTDDVLRLTEHLRDGAAAIFLVDDIHASRQRLETWTDALAEASKKLRKVEVIWVARTRAVAGKLPENVQEDLSTMPFPIENLISLCLHCLDSYKPWQRVIAALGTSLDPGLIRQLQKTSPPVELQSSSQIQQYVGWLEDTRRGSVDELMERPRNLGEEAYRLYMLLIPMACIGAHVDLRFIEDLGIRTMLPLSRLCDEGLARRYEDGKSEWAAMTVHPFQAKQILQQVGTWPERRLGYDLLRKRFPDCEEGLGLSEAAIGIYLSHDRGLGLSEEIERLGNSAEWAGISEPLAKALKFLLDRKDWTTDSSALSLARKWYRKTARITYTGDEAAFREDLQYLRSLWEMELAEAENDIRCKSGDNNRLDTILYEIGYLDYLGNSYASAEKRFADSIDAGLRAVEKAMLANPDSEERLDGARALSHIWIAGVLKRSAKCRSLMSNEIQDGFPTEADRLTKEVAEIHRRLAIANSISETEPGAKAAGAYLEALASLGAEWTPPPGSIPILPSQELPNSQGTAALERHERNSWHEAVRLSCWPKLYGCSETRIKVGVGTGEGEAKLRKPVLMVADDGMPALGDRNTKLLLGWAEGETQYSRHSDEAITIAALSRAGGGFEYLGDMILLAWHCTDDVDVRDALAWYLEYRVPEVGMNRLAKLALGRLLAQ